VAEGFVGVLGGVGINPAGGALGFREPEMSFKRVDLPAPLRPSRAILLVAVMLKVTSCKTSKTQGSDQLQLRVPAAEPAKVRIYCLLTVTARFQAKESPQIPLHTTRFAVNR